MGSIECCDVRQQSLPEYPLIKRKQLHLEAIYQLAPECQAKYKELVKKHNNDQFLQVPSSHVGNIEIQYRQGYIFIPNVNAYYSGQWNSENKPEGRGRIIFKNGSLLVGKFKQFKCNYENCHYFFKDGSYYFGAIKDNRLSGKGKFVNKILEYEGQWDKNLPDGKGEEFMGNGDRYIGTFIKGKKHGTKCTYKWLYHKMFSEYQGGFEEGLIRGDGTLTLKNSCKLSGVFKGQTIQNITLKSSICKYTGTIVKGKLQGRGALQITPRNQLFEGTYREGQLYGLCIHIDSKGRKNQCFIFKKKKLTKVVGLNDNEIQTLIKCIDEVYSTNDNHEQALEQLNMRFNGQYLCELIQPFAIQSGHKKYMVIHFNRYTIRILAAL